MLRGTQIVYTPTHARGDMNHPDSQSGFITHNSEIGGAVFCRYWSKNPKRPKQLRTKSNSELTPISLLVFWETVPQRDVEIALNKWCKDGRDY